MRLVFTVLVILFALSGLGLFLKLQHVPLEPAASAFTIKPAKVAANPVSGLVTVPTSGPFDETGTVIMDYTEGSPAIPYILYTQYKANGKPAVVTKRLIFQDRASCSAQGLPCATPQGGYPVAADQTVRVTGTVQDQSVLVDSVEILAAAS